MCIMSKKTKNAGKGKNRKSASSLAITQQHANGAAFTPQRPGVLALIVDLLKRATRAHPITKGEIVAKLAEHYSEREPAKMKTTVSMQVPSGLKIEKGYIVSREFTPLGVAFYIDPKLNTDELRVKHKGTITNAPVSAKILKLQPVKPASK